MELEIDGVLKWMFMGVLGLSTVSCVSSGNRYQNGFPKDNRAIKTIYLAQLYKMLSIKQTNKSRIQIHAHALTK